MVAGSTIPTAHGSTIAQCTTTARVVSFSALPDLTPPSLLLSHTLQKTRSLSCQRLTYNENANARLWQGSVGPTASLTAWRWRTYPVQYMAFRTLNLPLIVGTCVTDLVYGAGTITRLDFPAAGRCDLRQHFDHSVRL
jgi:hypothetical protein